MKQNLQFLTAVFAVVVCLTLLPGCVDNSSGFSNVSSGGSVSTGDWWFSSGNFYLRANEPGVLFGMQKTPDGQREFSYVVIFLHNSPDVDRPEGTGVGFYGTLATMKDGVSIHGQGIELSLELEADKKSETIQTRKMTIDGEDVDPAKGTLILVDLTARPVAHRQVKVNFPEEFPDPATGSVVNMAQQLTKELRRGNKSVEEFLKKKGFPEATDSGDTAEEAEE